MAINGCNRFENSHGPGFKCSIDRRRWTGCWASTLGLGHRWFILVRNRNVCGKSNNLTLKPQEEYQNAGKQAIVLAC